MNVIAVIPAYNEAGSIGEVVRAVRPLVDTVIVIDDGSQDRTSDVARQAGASLYRHALNRGQGAALKTGTEAALGYGADIIVHIDADGQHDTSFIPALLEPITQGRADVVFGSRVLGNAPGMPWTRRVLLAGVKLFNVLAMGIPRRVTDPQNGMRAMTRHAARTIDFRQDRMAHCSEILRLVTRSTLRWKEVPVRIRYSSASLAKGQKPTNALNIAWKLLLGLFAK